MAHSVQISPAARRQYRRLSADVQARISRALTALQDEPRPHGVVKLRGSLDRWRVRVGNYRIIYRIDDDGQIVIVLVIAHRREVYR